MMRGFPILLLFAVALSMALAGPPAAAGSSWARTQMEQSPVQWQPWNEATFAQIRAAGRSIYVFVGSEVSELSRSTLEQTLARRETADWLNANFVCVFVDADTQPDVAAYAQHYLATVKQQRGWPAHLWLTPELGPYDGSNYLPATEEWGRPGFLKSARSALDTWTSDPARARALAEEAVGFMRPMAFDQDAYGDAFVESLLARGTEAWLGAADPIHGGFGTAPKEPEPETIRFLLLRGEKARAVALRAADALVAHALHDRGEGGFFRRTLDAGWTEPHRQKSLLDQARIALALFAAVEAGGSPALRAAGAAALTFALREFRRDDGSWAAVLDPGASGGEAVGRGRARPAVLCLLAVALARSGESAHRRLAQGLVQEVKQAMAEGNMIDAIPTTVHDHLALSQALGLIAEPAAGAFVARNAFQTYFDRGSGVFIAGGSPLSPGLPLRVPSLPEPFRAEAFALGAWIADGPEMTKALRAWLSWSCEYDPLPSGEILLALQKAF